MSSEKVKASCNICCENRSTFIKCIYCNFDACSDCTQKYLLENIDSKCMSCSKGWSLEFIQTNFSNSFVNKKYKEHRENIFLEKEKALLPQTQTILENRNKIKQMNELIAKRREEIYNLEQEVLFLNGNQNVYKKRQEKIINCIVNDCRGFLTPHGQQTLKCGICSITVCKSCRERRLEKESKDEDHKCDSQLVESIKAIEKECKPCPKCGSYIYKISGCFEKNTEILLYDGTIKTAENIKTGDILVGDDGKPRKVLELLSGEDKMYKIKQNNGVEYIVNSKHELVLSCSIHKNISCVNNKYKVYYVENKNLHTILFDTIEEANKFNNSLLDEDKIIHISVDEYLEKSKTIFFRKSFLGFKAKSIDWINSLSFSESDNEIIPRKIMIDSATNKDWNKTSIEVEFVGVDKYYGWKVDGNTRFVLPDFTVVKNCDQLWCTQCRTAFSWRTGQIETGVVHNPHYWEYIRKHGNEDDEVKRQFGDQNEPVVNNPNEDLLNLNECDFRFENLVWNRDFMFRLDIFKNEITEVLREISHCQRYEIPRARVDIHDPKNNEDIRLKYLENGIDEKKFKMTIHRRQKLNEFKQELVQILETFVTVFRESTIRYYRLIMSVPKVRDLVKIKEFVKQWITEIRQVRDFTYNSIEKLCSRFNYTFAINLKDHFESYVRLSDSILKKINDQKQEKKTDEPIQNVLISRGFVTYSEEMREVMKEEFENKTGREIAKELFNLWKKTPADVKMYYREIELNKKQEQKE